MNSEDADDQSYQIPFAKVSQTAKRRESSSNWYNRNIEEYREYNQDDSTEDICKSQDLFLSLENTNPLIKKLATQQDHILQTKLGMKCGLTVVRNHSEHDTLISTGNWNYHDEELPHPRKLLNRKKSKKQLLPLKERRKNKKDDEGQGIKHLKQLMVKQSRRKSDDRLIIKFPFSNKNEESYTTNENTDHLTSISCLSECPASVSNKSPSGNDKKIILHQETVTVSTWDEVETWIHKRWKKASIPVKPIEE